MRREAYVAPVKQERAVAMPREVFPSREEMSALILKVKTREDAEDLRIELIKMKTRAEDSGRHVKATLRGTPKRDPRREGLHRASMAFSRIVPEIQAALSELKSVVREMNIKDYEQKQSKQESGTSSRTAILLGVAKAAAKLLETLPESSRTAPLQSQLELLDMSEPGWRGGVF